MDTLSLTDKLQPFFGNIQGDKLLLTTCYVKSHTQSKISVAYQTTNEIAELLLQTEMAKSLSSLKTSMCSDKELTFP